MVLICLRLNPLQPRMLCAQLGWRWPTGSKEEDSKILSMCFCYFIVVSLSKKCGPSFKQHSRMLGWYWPSSSWEKDYQILSMYFRNFIIFSPWKRVWPFIWKNLNPLYPRMLYVPSLVEICPVGLEKMTFKFHQCIPISFLSLLVKKGDPSFKPTWCPFTQGCFEPYLVEIGSVNLEKKIFKFCQSIYAICYHNPLEKGMALHLKKL